MSCEKITAGRCPDLNGVGKRRIHWPDPVRAPGCTGIWTDAWILYHGMAKEDAMKNKNVWFAYAAAWISTATAVIFAIKYTGSAWSRPCSTI